LWAPDSEVRLGPKGGLAVTKLIFDPEVHHHRSTRLPDYDYAQSGAYFVTICTQGRMCLFGEVVDGKMQLNEFGLMVQEEWLRTESIRAEVELDVFVVMPNHFHGVVVITTPAPHIGGTSESVGTHGRASLRRAPKSLGSLVAGFKSVVTKRINQLRNTPGIPVWQRNYYERVVRNERELDVIRQYIVDNPAKWPEDKENLQF